MTCTPATAESPGAWIEALRRRVEHGLAEAVPGHEPAAEAVRDLLAAGGKRLRALLVYL
jgi:geranylgeranyl pyrophosphate synthase